jgi:hypothetical protein
MRYSVATYRLAFRLCSTPSVGGRPGGHYHNVTAAQARIGFDDRDLVPNRENLAYGDWLYLISAKRRGASR